MKYKQLNNKMKEKIDILLSLGHSMRHIGRLMSISHSTVSRYKNKIYSKRIINIRDKFSHLINFLSENYEPKVHSVEVCLYRYKRFNPDKPCVTAQQIYNWINQGKLDIKPNKMCYKRRKRKAPLSGMMNHLKWLLHNKTVLPISIRPKYIERRDEIGHLEIDYIIDKRNENTAIISIVDRCSRVLNSNLNRPATSSFKTWGSVHLYNGEIMALSIDDKQDIEFALDMLHLLPEITDSSILHSDQGSVSTSCSYQSAAQSKGITMGMSNKRTPVNSVSIESFYAMLKSETLTRAVIKYIKDFNTF